MKKSVFVTGIAGSGKSTVSRALNKLGYKAYDIESDEYGLFMMVRKDTGKRYLDFDNADMLKVNNSSWICDTAKLKELLNKQTEDIAFYCGIASNNEEVMFLFHVSILLQVSPEVLNRRLLTREGTGDCGNTEAGRQRVLSWKGELEERMMRLGMIAVDADSNPKEVAEKIIRLVS